MGGRGGWDAPVAHTATGPGGKPKENKCKIDVFGDGGCRELRSAPSGAPGGLRGGPGAHFGVPGGPVGAPGSDFRAPRIDSELRFLVSGALRNPKLPTKLLLATAEIIFEHTETILNCSFFNV